MRNILYTAGSHGNFIKYLFDCYDVGKILDMPFNKNGNSHNQSRNQLNRIYDICNKNNLESFIKESKITHEHYAVQWEGIEQFYYVLQCYTDRGAALVDSGIELMEKDLINYENIYGVDVEISSILKKNFNFNCAAKGQPPRSVLRNYFLLSFFSHFEHTHWKKNKELTESNYKKIHLFEIWNYSFLQEKLFKIFNKILDFKHVHEQFLDKNIPLEQLRRVKIIIDAIEKKENIKICDLNIISEAYVLFLLECKYFDIPFLSGNNFFKTTQEIIEYADYFPNYMKKPNNLFFKYYKYFTRHNNVDI
jgi:DNA-binding ferritin-like protein (Dps family)